MGRLFLLLVVTLATGACASTGHSPQPFPRPAGPGAPSPAPVGSVPPTTLPADGYGVTGSALALRGTPYRNGGADPSGFDCSGFVWYVFAQHGVAVPRTVGAQYQAGRSVDTGALEPGDLVFFTTTSAGASHVGIALGGDEFVHAPSSNGEVRVERLSAPYWASRYLGARRVL